MAHKISDARERDAGISPVAVIQSTSLKIQRVNESFIKFMVGRNAEFWKTIIYNNRKSELK